MKCKFGFTLTEMLVVVLVAAGILMFAIPSYKRTKERSNYEAAVGTLVKLGSAVQTFKKDLQLKGVSMTIPSGSMQIQRNDLTKTSLGPYFTLNKDTLQAQTLAGLIGMIIPAGYLDDFPVDNSPLLGGYSYYLFGGGTANVCSQTVSGTDVVAYMKYTKVSDNSSGCYCGAVYKADGTIQRLAAPSCAK